VSEKGTGRSFVAAGSGEAREGGPSYEGRIIRRGDQSPEAIREKARFRERLPFRAFVFDRLGLGHDKSKMLRNGSSADGMRLPLPEPPPRAQSRVAEAGSSPAVLADPRRARHWASSSIRTAPLAVSRPVQGLDFEMDVRGVAHELVI
jgi:hypothetical protein